ncbi:MAG: glycosyltransferase family 2 protein [Armatimonadetes bacterium]|nr:glycosyltransferase family 2 protein [Armatimonadota bacterium]
MKVSVIIPAYNEEDNLKELIPEIKKIDISHPYNIGNGAAVKSGARTAQGDYLVFMDADFQHPPTEIPRLLDALKEYNLVVGARSGRNLSFRRTLLNKILNSLAGFLVNKKILDLTSGFRAIRKELFLEFIHLLPNTFSYPSTLTLAVFKAGYSVKYELIPEIQRRKKGKSKINLFKDGILFLSLCARMIILFDPLKVFLPVSLFLLTLGFIFAVYQLITKGGLFGASIITLLIGIFIFFFGFLADQIAALRREIKYK